MTSRSSRCTAHPPTTSTSPSSATSPTSSRSWARPAAGLPSWPRRAGTSAPVPTSAPGTYPPTGSTVRGACTGRRSGCSGPRCRWSQWSRAPRSAAGSASPALRTSGSPCRRPGSTPTSPPSASTRASDSASRCPGSSGSSEPLSCSTPPGRSTGPRPCGSAWPTGRPTGPIRSPKPSIWPARSPPRRRSPSVQ